MAVRIDAHAHVVEELVVVGERRDTARSPSAWARRRACLPTASSRCRRRRRARSSDASCRSGSRRTSSSCSCAGSAGSRRRSRARPRASGRRGCRWRRASRRNTRGNPGPAAKAGEDEAAIGLVRYRRQPTPLGLVQPRSLVALLQRNVEEGTVAYGRSRRGTGSGTSCRCCPQASPTTFVPLCAQRFMQHAHLAVGVAHHDHRLARRCPTVMKSPAAAPGSRGRRRSRCATTGAPSRAGTPPGRYRRRGARGRPPPGLDSAARIVAISPHQAHCRITK